MKHQTNPIKPDERTFQTPVDEQEAKRGIKDEKAAEDDGQHVPEQDWKNQNGFVDGQARQKWNQCGNVDDENKQEEKQDECCHWIAENHHVLFIIVFQKSEC